MRTILVIDDEPEKSLPLVEHLRQEGYGVLFADNGRQGLALYAEEKPDIVICDLEMPTMGGYDVLEKMSSALNMGNLPFILMHETFDETIFSRLIAGRYPDCHILKPIDLREVAIYVRRIFRYVDEDAAGASI